jgi:hypothetical protein
LDSFLHPPLQAQQMMSRASSPALEVLEVSAAQK